MELIRVQDSDYKKTYERYMSFPENENGYMNNVYGYDYNRFLAWIEKKCRWSLGQEVPEGFVADGAFEHPAVLFPIKKRAWYCPINAKREWLTALASDSLGQILACVHRGGKI